MALAAKKWCSLSETACGAGAARLPYSARRQMSTRLGNSRLLGVAIVVWSSGAAGVAAQESAATRSAAVITIQDAITVDGELSEPIWLASPTIGHLIQRQPLPGEAPTERPKSHFCATRTISTSASSRTTRSRAGHRHADGARRQPRRRRSHRDPARHVPRSAERVLFRDQPGGRAGRRPGFANGQLNTEWDAIWDVRTRAHRRGLDRGVRDSVQEPELSRPAQDVWGFNIARTIYRKLEENRWSGARLDTQFLRCPRPARSRISAG